MAASECLNKQEISLEKASLIEQIQHLVSQRLPGSCAHSLCMKHLDKRKRKWRKRHNIQASQEVCSAPNDHQQRDEFKALLNTSYNLQTQLASTRREGLDAAMKLRAEKWDHCLQAVDYRLGQLELSLEGLRKQELTPTPTSPSIPDVDNHQTILDLQTALAKAISLKTVKNMKLYETPQLPVVNSEQPNESLTQISQDITSMSPIEPIFDGHNPTLTLPDHIEDSIDCNNNCNIPVVMTTEVSTSTFLPNTEPQDNLSMPISFMPPNPNLSTLTTVDPTTDTDPSPHIGMEVVCHGGLVSSPVALESEVVVGSSSIGLIPISMHQELVSNGDQHRTPVNTKPSPSISTSRTRRRSKRSSHQKRQSKSKSKSPTLQPVVKDSADENGVPSPLEDMLQLDGTLSETDTDSDSQMRKMLEVLERVPYNLRVPQNSSGESVRYSFTNGISVTASVKKRRRSRTPRERQL